MTALVPRLLPLSGVAVGEGSDQFVAVTGEPWLELLGFELRRLRGRMIEIVYRASLLDQPARPLIRFFLDDGSRVDRIAAAPIAGAGIWVGRMPAGTCRVAISPTGRAGLFGFRLEGMRARSWLGLLLEGAERRPRQTRSALLTKLIGWAPESDNNLAWAIGAFDLQAFSGWSKRRLRPPEPDGLDRPRDEAEPSPSMVLLMPIGEGYTRTVASLREQLHADWELLLIDGRPTGGDRRIVPTDQAQASERLAALPPRSLVGRLSPGDMLPPHALAFLAEQRRREPAARLFYGDEIAHHRLALKPGWSPRLMAALPYLGSAAFVAVGGWSGEERRAFVDRGALPHHLLDDAGQLLALRRVILQTDRPLPVPAVAAVMRTGDPRDDQPAARAAIIIPTCDQPALLRRVVGSIRARTAPDGYRLIIIDNGEADGPGRDLLVDLARADDVTVLRRTDAFNFSGFCNDAVAACDEHLLVFLNDDMEVLSEGWLRRLARLACKPDVGAVGAKLTYPDGRLQHVGVLVGMGGSAGHLGALAPGDDPGWLGRNGVPHEVSAVTGACLAVGRDKFLAVGGFDAV